MTTIDDTKLFPYQQEGVHFLIDNNGGFLLDEQGLGKTIQTIRALNKLYHDAEISKILIVCPAIMRLTWEQELKDWFEGPVTIQVITKKSEPILKSNNLIVVCSYEYLASHYATTKPVAFEGFDAVVFDESHKVKNPKSNRTRAFLQFFVHRDNFVKFKVLLTGTPITKGIDDLYTQLRPFFDKETAKKLLGRNIWEFRERFMHKKVGLFGTEYYGCRKPEELKDIMAKVSLRRKKCDVLKELPQLLHEKVYIDVPKTLADESLQYVDVAIRAVMGDSWKGVDKDELDHIATMRKNLGVAKIKGAVEYIKYLLDKEDSRYEANK